MSDYYDDFKMNVRHYRECKGWTQAELAIQANSSIGQIGNIESGKSKPSFNNIINIAEALGIHPADLFLRNASRLLNNDLYDSCSDTIVKLCSLPPESRTPIEDMISDMSSQYEVKRKKN